MTDTKATPETANTSSTPEAKASPTKPEGNEGQTPKATPATPTEGNATPPKGEEAKPKEGAAGDKENATPKEVEKVVPEKYDLKLPENLVVDPEDLGAFEEMAKAGKLSNEEAQKVLEEQVARQTKLTEAKSERWRKETESDPEIGGEKLGENVEFAKRAISKFFGPDLAKELERTGYGNRLTIVKGFAQIGRLLGEDTFVPAGKAPAKEVSIAEKFYGSSSS